jgi:branched-chain amino acid transport system substrate-binding protein
VPGGWVYASGFATTDQGLAMLRYIKLRGWKKIALISTTDASGQTLEADMMSSAALPEFQGLTVVAREHLGVTDTTADAQMARIKGAAPDVIVPMLLGTPLGNVLRSGRDQAIDLPYVVSPPNLNYKQMETYKTLIPAKDFYIIGFPGADSRTIHDRAVVRATTEFTQAVNAAGIPADVGAAIIWDSARIIVEAYRQAGTGASPAQVRKAINGVRNYSGVFGKYDFTASPQRGVLPFWNVMDRYDVGTDQFVAVSKPGDLVGK